jgi:hypothetical protein
MAENSTVRDWLAALGDAVAEARFVKATLSKPTSEAGDLKSIDIRPISVKRTLMLSFTYHHKTRDVVKNYPPHESLALLAELFGAQFAQAKLYTQSADLHLAQTGDQWRLSEHPPTHTEAPALSHDRAKNRLVESRNKPYLQALGLTDAKGDVYKNAQDKFRQINKYIEILDGLVKQLPQRESVRIVDMGAGKGYLTFALYDHLVNTRGMKAEVTGVETRVDLVNQCNNIANAAQFSGLRFAQGSIADYDCTGANIVIALHACDTATDDAIHKAIRAGAALIVVAPCCHKQIRRAMAPAVAAHPLAFLMQYGTYVERIAEMVTDGMRAQLIELHGYRTNLFEFIADAHTPKNVMIVATKSAPLTPDSRTALLAQITASKTQFSISHHRLEQLLS